MVERAQNKRESRREKGYEDVEACRRLGGHREIRGGKRRVQGHAGDRREAVRRKKRVRVAVVKEPINQA